MSTVATSLVATVMNANFSALTTTSLSSSATQEFSSVLKQVNSESSGGDSAMKADGQASDQTKTHMAEGEEAKQPVHETGKKPVEGPGDQVAEEAKQAMEEVSSEAVDMKNVVNTEEAEAMMDEALVEISQLLDMSEEDLESLLDEMDIDVLDLHDPSILANVIQETYNLETPTEILVVEEAAEAYMEVTEVIESLEENLGIQDMEVLKEQMAMMSGGEGTADVEVADEVVGETFKPVEPQLEGLGEGEGKATNFEVVDLRVKAADQGSGNEQSPGQQGQSFGEFMSDQMTQIKDIAVDMKADLVDFQQVSAQEVIDQIITKAAVTVEVDKTSMTMQLNPEHLGKVAVSVTAEQGVIKGQFVAENQQVKEMLEISMVQLKEQLEEQGIKVDKIEVALGSTNQFYDQSKGDQQQQEQSNRQSSSRVGRISRMMTEDLDMADITETISQTTVYDESTVEYSA